ncbi:MAG TPA: DUF2834 domain-containing protein [Sandaracinaceae bacterium LLY-WYZ-13_1]|nr:DUF2834 domain-containing protein [Sandaracinaceae bacterium LLY-WYZ-13_1]
MNARLIAPLGALLAFTAFSLWVVAGHGYFGFLELALAEPWGAQMLADLVVALVLFTLWMVPDARAHAIPRWPYLAAIVAFGSIGALAYLVHRAVRRGAGDRGAERVAQGSSRSSAR